MGRGAPAPCLQQAASIERGGLPMIFRAFLILALVTVALAGGAFADDGPKPAKPTTISGPTAAEFLPMTRSERLRNYLLGIADGESIVRAAASAGVRQAEN